jgi:hypothetical protein
MVGVVSMTISSVPVNLTSDSSDTLENNEQQDRREMESNREIMDLMPEPPGTDNLRAGS